MHEPSTCILCIHNILCFIFSPLYSFLFSHLPLSLSLARSPHLLSLSDFRCWCCLPFILIHTIYDSLVYVLYTIQLCVMMMTTTTAATVKTTTTMLMIWPILPQLSSNHHSDKSCFIYTRQARNGFQLFVLRQKKIDEVHATEPHRRQIDLKRCESARLLAKQRVARQWSVCAILPSDWIQFIYIAIARKKKKHELEFNNCIRKILNGWSQSSTSTECLEVISKLQTIEKIKSCVSF